MSNSRFVKYIPSEKSIWLRKNYTALYLLLTVVIERARWNSEDSPEGLKQGDAILGESAYLDAAITRQQYRDAISKGSSLGIWEVVWNPKIPSEQKRTIKGTMKSLVVNLKSSDIWDLNLKQDNHIENQHGTMREPSENHKQRKKEYKKEKEEQQARETRTAAEPPDKSSSIARIEEEYLCLKTDGLQGESDFQSERPIIYDKCLNSNELRDNKNNICQEKRRVIQPSSQALDLLAQFASSLAQHVPEVSLPLKKSQAKNFDSLLKKHDAEKIKQTFHFAHQHNFWRQRIHAASDLERNFSKVLAEFNSGKIVNHHHPPSASIANGKEFETEIDPFLLKITGERVYES